MLPRGAEGGGFAPKERAPDGPVGGARLTLASMPLRGPVGGATEASILRGTDGERRRGACEGDREPRGGGRAGRSSGTKPARLGWTIGGDERLDVATESLPEVRPGGTSSRTSRGIEVDRPRLQLSTPYGSGLSDLRGDLSRAGEYPRLGGLSALDRDSSYRPRGDESLSRLIEPPRLPVGEASRLLFKRSSRLGDRSR